MNNLSCLEKKLPKIKADSGRLEQVFINFLVNARDAIEEKCEKTNCKIESNQIEITTYVKEKKVYASVKDSGFGISDEALDRLFEPFFTTKEVGKGTGLGLSISYGIIKECKGEIVVKLNEDDDGTCFILHFPALL